MITEVKEKRTTNLRDVNYEFDGHWVLLRTEPSDGRGAYCVVAYGDGTAEDRDALHRIVIDRYKGRALLTYGYTPREEVVSGIYDC